jgi:TolB-like protein
VFDVLVHLIENRDRVVGKEELLKAVWKGRIVSDNTLSSRINAARRAIGDDGEQQRLIRTFPRKGLRFVAEVKERGPSTPVRNGAVLGGAAFDKPSIAVLPFANMSGDPDQEYFVDGITDDIITALSRWRWFLVIARNSSFAFKSRAVPTTRIGDNLGARYLVEGSVRRSKGRVRITAQLVDARAGRHIWADRYDRDIADVFAVQDEIAQRVAAAVDPAIRGSEMTNARRKPPERMDAWDHFLRGTYHFYKNRKRDSPLALEHLQRAVEIDPQFGSAHARLACAYTNAASRGWAASFGDAVKTAVSAARTAIDLDAFDSSAHAAACFALTFARQYEPALASGQRAIELNPNFHWAHFVLAMARTFAGAPMDAIPALDENARLSPRDPTAWAYLSLRALAYFTAREYRATVEAADLALAERPGYGGAMIVKSAALARVGCVRQAAGLLANVAPIAFQQLPFALPYRGEADFEHLLVALEGAQYDPRLIRIAREGFGTCRRTLMR